MKPGSEDYEQAVFVQWFRASYPDMLIFAIPNGGSRHIVEAAKLKATGTLAGVPDLFVPALRVFIEMKKCKGGRVSDSQNKIAKYLERVGYTVLFCKGAEDAKKQINEEFLK